MVLVFDINTCLHVVSEYNHFKHGHVGIGLCGAQVTPEDSYGIIQMHVVRVGKARPHRKWCTKCLVLFRA